MDKLLRSNTIASYACPHLVYRHTRQLAELPNSRILYYKQAHEIYVYTYFKNVHLSSHTAVLVNNLHGCIRGAVDVKDIQLGHSVNEEFFYDALKFVPCPFIFIPDAALTELSGFCKEAHRFVDGQKEGILMSIEFASGVGIDFIGAEYLQKNNTAIYYIGLVYIRAMQ